MRTIAAIFLLVVSFAGYGQWNPDAGLVVPYTHQAEAIASGTNPQAAIDGNLETKWESEPPLPSGYISSADQNLFQNTADYSVTPSGANAAFDGNTETAATLKNGAFQVTFDAQKAIKMLSVKASGQEPIGLHIISGSTVNEKHTITPDDAYKLIKIPLSTENISSIRLSSPAPFALFELAGLNELPYTEIVFDLKRARPVGWIETRHFAGEHVATVDLSIAGENGSFRHLTSLHPGALNTVTTRFGEQQIRYIKLRYRLDMVDYAKAFLWEVKAYNKYGPFGPEPAFRARHTTLRNITGINTFWGWGLNRHADELPDNKGAAQFSSFMQQVRYYHNLDWDIATPGDSPDYSNMPGSLNQAWLDWDREYLPVWKLGFSIQATLQIPENFSPEVWDSTFQAAYRFGSAFAEYFGNTRHRLVEAVEIGNEPWQWGPDFYRGYFEGMARGIHERAPHMKVLPCALSANKQQPQLNNYAGQWLKASDRELIDGFNTHLYSYATNNKGEQVAVHPEHPASEMRGLLNVLRFRDHNLPGKEVHVTEWGWDSSSEAADCTHPVCVSEEAQAAYAVRGMLWLYRMGVDKMHWYFFADENKSSHRFTRSGLLSSPDNGLQPKASYYALRETLKEVGDVKLYDISEQEGLMIYYFRDEHKQPSHIVVWVPETHDETMIAKKVITLPGKPVKAFFPAKRNRPAALNHQGRSRYSLEAGTYPAIITF